MKEQAPMTAEQKILKAFELTFSVKPQNIFDVMNLSVEEFVDVLDNFLHNEQNEANAKVLEALEEVKKVIIEKDNDLNTSILTVYGVADVIDTVFLPKYK